MQEAHFLLRHFFATLGLQGEDLVLRSVGEQAFPVLQSALQGVTVGRALWLDSTGVRVMDTSFLDETVVELVQGLVCGSYDERYLILLEPSGATIDNLEGTIARRGGRLAVLIQRNDEYQIVGHIEPNLFDAWQRVRQRGELTARELADALGLAINTASMRLRKLHAAHLLARVEDLTPDGRQHVYRLPV